MQVVGIALEFSRTHPHKSNAVAVFRIHVCVNFKNEPGELVFRRINHALFSRARQRIRCNIDKAIQHFLYAEIINRRAEKHRVYFAAHIRFPVKIGINRRYHFHFFTQFGGGSFAHVFFQVRVIEVIKLYRFFRVVLLSVRTKQDQLLLINIVNTLKTLPHTDGPRQRYNLQIQFSFDLIEQIHCVFSLAVEFIDEYDNRSFTHFAHADEFFGLLLYPFRHVDNHNGTIHRRQSPIGIFRKILVTRRIQNINFAPAILKPHHGSRHRDTPLPFDFHKIGGRSFLDFIRLYRPGRLYRPAKQQQLFRQSRLARIGVRDNTESTAFLYFFC